MANAWIMKPQAGDASRFFHTISRMELYIVVCTAFAYLEQHEFCRCATTTVVACAVRVLFFFYLLASFVFCHISSFLSLYFCFHPVSWQFVWLTVYTLIDSFVII